MSYQKIIITGNLGRDPEMRFLADGTAVTNLNVATNRRWNNADGSKGEETTWWRCTAWRKTAEIAAQYLGRGHQVMIEGRMTPGENGAPKVFQKNDGSWGASYEMTIERLILLNNRGTPVAEGETPPAEDEEAFT